MPDYRRDATPIRGTPDFFETGTARGSSGFGAGKFQALARVEPVILQTVRLADDFDRHPGILRGRVVFYNYGPQSVAGSHSVGAVRLIRFGSGTGVECARDNGRQKHRHRPSPAIFVRYSHPLKIKDKEPFPNSFLQASRLSTDADARALHSWR